jgi:uncharacterized membrane protein
LELDDILNDEALRRIEDAIRTAELGTSGEIRVHVDETCVEDPLDHAAYLFSELGMHRTALRNGVLIYLSWMDRKLAIIGDAGINAVTGDQFWHTTRDAMIEQLRHNDLVGALCTGASMAGEQLRAHFPVSAGDVNELSNTVSRGPSRKTSRP